MIDWATIGWLLMGIFFLLLLKLLDDIIYETWGTSKSFWNKKIF